MELGFDFILEHLRERFPVTGSRVRGERTYGRPAVYRNDTLIEPRRIYLVDEPDAVSLQNESDVLWIILLESDLNAETRQKAMARFMLEHSSAVGCCIAVSVSDANCLLGIYECLVDLFDKETTWHEEMLSLCIDEVGSSLQALLDAGAGVLNDALFYFPVDEWRGCICSSSIDRVDGRLAGLFGDDGQPYPKGVDFKRLETIVEALEPTTASVLDRWGSAIDVLGVSVRDDTGLYRGLLLVPLSGPHASCAQKWHIARTRDYFQRFINLRVQANSEEEFAVYDLLRLLLTALPESLGGIKRRLRSHGIACDGSYVCGFCDFFDRNGGKVSLKQCCRIVETMADGCHAIDLGQGVLVVVNLDESGVEPRLFFQSIIEFFVPLEVRVGISFAFSDLLRLRLYVEQSKAALELSLASSCHIHEFRSVAVRYIITRGTGELPAHMLCAPGALELQRASDCGDVDYIGTFEVFARNFFNASAAARQLNVCRTALLYRLKRIEEITGMDLSNVDDVFYLELSLLLLKSS